MFKKIIFLTTILIVTSACKSEPINQMIHKKREGQWIESFVNDTIIYSSKGTYKNSDEIKTWRFFENKKLVRKAKYKKDYCFKTFYHPNGKIESKGKTKTDSSENQLYWFYDGIWKFYDTDGHLIGTKTYQQGQLISSITINKK